MIVLGERREDLNGCASVEKIGRADHPYAMPHEPTSFIAGLKPPLNEIWPSVKNWN